MESSHFPWGSTSAVFTLCGFGHAGGYQGEGSNEMAHWDPTPDDGCLARAWIFRAQVWRGGNRCPEVGLARSQKRTLTVYPRSLRPLVISLIPGQEKQLEKLKRMRMALQKEVGETIEEFGPKLYEDFDEVGT